MSTTIRRLLAVEYGREQASTQDPLDPVVSWPGISISLFDDRVMICANANPVSIGRRRVGDRAWCYARLFGTVNVGFDIARPGAYKRPLPASQTPWLPENDEQELEMAIWETRDATSRVLALLSKKPEEPSLEEVVARAC